MSIIRLTFNEIKFNNCRYIFEEIILVNYSYVLSNDIIQKFIDSIKDLRSIFSQEQFAPSVAV